MDKNHTDFKKQHLDNYRQAVLSIIENNTNMLIDDIHSLIRKPPLDSMDTLKSRILDGAKKNKIVVDADQLSSILNDYRIDLELCSEKIKDTRYSRLSKSILNKKLKEGEVFQLFKKDFNPINKEIKNELKNQLESSFEKILLKRFHQLFDYNISSEVQEKMLEDITKYYQGQYRKQLLESFDIKVLVKDTTLMNSIKEQSERYLFTLNNSRLLNDF